MATDSDRLTKKLWRSSYQGNDGGVLDLLKRGVDPNSEYYKRKENGVTPLHLAASFGYPINVQNLIQWGAELDAITNKSANTPLWDACKHNNKQSAEILLRNHCHTDITNKHGETAMDIARLEGYTALTDYVVSYKVPPRGPLSSYPSVKQMSTLQVTQWSNLGCFLGVPKAELETLKNKKHPTAATLLAAKIKNPDMRWKEIVESLLTIEEYELAEAVCVQRAVDGHSPLSVAVYYGWLDLFKYLDTKGQDPKEPINEAGDTVLSLACARGHVGLIDYVLKTKGIDLDGPVNAAGDNLMSIADSRGLSEVIEYLKNYSPESEGVGKLQLKYMQRLDELIKKRKKSTYLQYLKMYFIGSAGLGKTTTRKRLTGAIVNLSKLSPKERKRCSTYLAECTQVLAVVDDSSNSKLILQASENLDEEARMLFNYLYGSKSTGEEETDAATITTSIGSNDPSSTDTQQGDAATEVDPTQPKEQAKDTEQTKQEEEATGREEQVKQKPASTHVTVDVDQVVTKLRSIVGSGRYAEELLGKILLNLVDVGGQPGFLEMLPFLSKGPGIFLAFFPLDKDLDEQFEVSYERGDDKITPYKATYTTREALSQILSSVSHHASFNSTINEEHAEKLSSFCDVKPVATLVGTFKDRLETQVKAELLHKQLSNEFPTATQADMEEAVRRSLGDAEVSKEPSADKPGLQSAVEHHLSTKPFKEEVKDRVEEILEEKNEALESITLNFAELLSFPTADRCFIPVDNYTGTDSDIDPLRKHLQEVFSSHFKDAKVPIQPSQLLLGVVLRKEYDIVSMEDCIQIGRALNMGEEDVRFTVWFLDFLVGALIYHPEIDDEWFKENIICSPQVVFDSISTLITEALLEFHSEKKIAKLKLAERKDWLEKGQFSIDTVKRCHSKESEKKVKEGKLIPVEKLVMLLEHSNLLAQITVKEKVGGKERVKIMCFIPAILECATPEQLTKSPPPDADTPSPVKITFEPRYVPIGVFCATISRLVSRGKDGILGMKWELADSCVKRNLVTFRVDSAKHIVTLVAHVECIEVRVIRQKRRITLHDLSAYVLSAVTYVIKEIDSLVDPIIAFDCPCGQHQSRSVDKLCCLLPGVSPCFECEHGEVDTLSSHQQCWFTREVKPESDVCLKALKYATELDPDLSFKWKKDGSIEGSSNELRARVEKVTEDDCDEIYYTCEILKNGKPFFNVYRCLKVAGEVELSAGDKLLGEVKEALSEVRFDWYSLAVELDIDHGTRKAIEKDYRLQGVEVRFHAMLQKWVGTASAATARATLVKALRSPAIDRNDIATANFESMAARARDVPMCEGSLCDTLHVDKHLKMVRAATWDARAKWNDIAVQLEISGGDRKEIEYNHPTEAGPCLTALFEKWLTRSSPAPTWTALIDALRSQQVDRADIANDIERALN